MALTYHCRAEHIKQVAIAPTKSRLQDRTRIPGPMEYNLPDIVGGKGYSTIARAPAYTFGIKHKQIEPYKGGGKNYNICGFTKKGKNRITHSIISPRLEPPAGKDRLPGPAEYFPDLKVQLKRPPAFTILSRCHEKYDSGTMWTPPPNMYYPPIKGKKPPAFSLIGKLPPVKEHSLPGPSDYDPNFHYVQQTVPRFTIRGKVDPPEKLFPSPAPNEYCSKRLHMSGWECRSRLLKQRPVKPTTRRGDGGAPTPGPARYEQPTLYCGHGFSHIKRAPAYSFGLMTPVDLRKPAVLPTAPQLNCQGLANKGPHHITHSVVTPAIKPLSDTLAKLPGPGHYEPRHEVRFRRPPMYSMKKRPRAPHHAEEIWSPPCNMYKPPINSKKEPAYSIQIRRKEASQPAMPGPGHHDPNFKYVLKTTPHFSFGAPFRNLNPMQKPDPATYCAYKFGKSAPAPSFGIRHSPFVGVQKAYELPRPMGAIAEEYLRG